MNEQELRDRMTKAAAMGETIGARLNPDGSYDVVVPTPVSDLERAREKRVNAKHKWRGVTNELVVSHADPDCKVCSGHGELITNGESDVCRCAEDMFEAAYKGRLRWNASRHRAEVFV